jgi:hypothetical protein
VFDWLNRVMLSSVPPSKDFITTIFPWLHEFPGRTGMLNHYYREAA